MPLARIITRSHQCSRELAVDLLARGYTVEIVSPDKIPDNIADLELRVDAGPGDQLTANVKTHTGEHSASLDFVHHLRSPMMDFIRRPPDPSETVHFPEQSINFDAEPDFEDMERLAEAAQPAPEPISPAAEIPLNSIVNYDHEEDPSLVTAPLLSLIVPLTPEPIAEPDPLPAVEPPRISLAEDAILVQPLAQSVPAPLLPDSSTTPASPPVLQSALSSQQSPQQSSQRIPQRISQRSSPRQNRHLAPRYRRTAIISVSIVLVALLLGFGMRRTTGGASDQNSLGPENVAAATTHLNVFIPPDVGKGLGRPSPAAVSAPVVIPKSAPAHATTHASTGATTHAIKESVPESASPKVAASSAHTPAKISHKHSEDLIARDTVTYLDKSAAENAPAKAKVTKRSVHRHPSTSQHGGVIAANSVTYLSNNPTPKTPK
jgi:hypothetical protein